MDKVSDFFKELKERLSNPLIYSYIISWLIINWQIPISLFFYSQKELKEDGFISYIDLISKKYSAWSFIIYPLILALLYTFLFPFIRNGILAFQTWIKKWGTDLNLKIAETGKVSMLKYIQLRENYHSQTKLLEDLYAQESSFITENDKLKTDNITLTTEKNYLLSELDRWNKLNSPGILNGEWELKSKIPDSNNLEISHRIRIADNVFSLIDIKTTRHTEVYNIRSFFNNIIKNEVAIFFIKANTSVVFVQLLTPENNFTELNGKQYSIYNSTETFEKGVEVTYKKIGN